MRWSREQLYAVGGLALLALLAYVNAFTSDFVLDSRVIVLEDPRIREVSASNLELIANHTYWWPYKGADDLYRPATTLSYLLNYAVLGNGTQPFGYHAVNVLLHVANALLVFAVGSRISGRFWEPLALSAVWAVHPLGTEAVANLVGRADLLAALGIVGAFYAYLRATSDGGSRWWFAGAFAAATLGVFSKESAAVIPAIVIAYDLLVRQQRTPPGVLAAGWASVAVPVLLLLHRRSIVLESLPPVETLFVDNPIIGAGPVTGLLTALAVLPRYVWLTVWPMRLSADYSYAQIPLATGSIGDVIAWLALTGLCAAAVVGGRRRPLVAFSGVAAFLLILPASNVLITTGTIMGERLAYLPMLGVLACLGVAANAGLERFGVEKRLVAAACAILVAALMARTWVRNADWHDEVSIWRAAAAASPNSFKSHQGYADALYESDPTRANLAEVVEHSRRSAEIIQTLPDEAVVLRVYRLAAVYALEYGDQLAARGDERSQTESRAQFDAAAGHAQRHVDAVLAVRGLDAIEHRRDEAIVSEAADAYRLLATAQARRSAGPESLAAAARARALQPLSPHSYRSTAAAQVAARRYDDAAATFLAGFMVTGDASLRESVVALYRGGLDSAGCAMTSGPNGPTLNPACEPVRRHLCLASREAVVTQNGRGREDLAESLVTAALENFGCPPSFFPSRTP